MKKYTRPEQFDLTTRVGRYRARKAGFDVPKRNSPFVGVPFDQLVDRTSGDGCWEWTGGFMVDGYGRFKQARAHRHAWSVANGPIPSGMVICHRCDNPRCVRQDHLFLGTHADNQRDCQAKGRNPGNRLPRGWRLTLSSDAVRGIRAAVSGGVSIHQTARDYGVSYTTARNVVRGAYV